MDTDALRGLPCYVRLEDRPWKDDRTWTGVAFSMFRKFVTEKNIPECKKFIDSYVDKVIVYKDHLEVTFKVALYFEQENNLYSFKTSVKLASLFKTCKRAAGL
ncbi:hypothetical protein Desor_2008 [Desulfosporosinus orientis DSM 765]|uniref:Uncharacterized protein n=1 Tax=Desulfosporosinus orientis (strain ATCC 19365 / DSM 765 / NCIMB 8382 / VKM B-1628 / Singapore I) TaxID=768706 RepID=G7WF06_DESOD|nr:hypothetical protein Desor_2008 [Desulfosporosinus orientis DSM 765]